MFSIVSPCFSDTLHLTLTTASERTDAHDPAAPVVLRPADAAVPRVEAVRGRRRDVLRPVGYIIAVVSILDIGKGMFLPGSGQAEFVTRYRAIVFQPFEGEVVDGVVKNVKRVCCFG